MNLIFIILRKLKVYKTVYSQLVCHKIEQITIEGFIMISFSFNIIEYFVTLNFKVSLLSFIYSQCLVHNDFHWEIYFDPYLTIS